MSFTKRQCDNCSKEYLADNRNLKRGWGLCCSKSCSASKREKSKPTWNIKTVAENNERRRTWNERKTENWEHDDDQSWDAHKDSF
jgi:hypothetical protein